MDKLQKVLLIIVALGLIPIALSYGLFPEKSLNYLFGITTFEINTSHIFRAIMSLYLAMVIFWILGAVKVQFRIPALYGMVVFMFGLASGRILSMVLDGIPNWLLNVYLGMEMFFGFFALVLILKSKNID